MTTDVLRVPGNYLVDATKGNITLDVTPSGGSTGTVTINGNLVVYGANTSVASTNTNITDNTITINSGEINTYVTAGTSGIIIDRGANAAPANSATLLYNDNSYWNVDGTSNRGVFEFRKALYGSAIMVNAIRIDTASTSTLNILGNDNPVGTINVLGTVDYETRVTHDDDIPNKKYVDQAIYSGTDVAKRLLVGNTSMRVADQSVPFGDPFYGTTDKIWAYLTTSTNVVFRLEGSEAQLQGLTINHYTIEVNTSTSDLILQPQTGNSVKISSSLKLQKITSTPTAESNHDTLYYTGTAGGGGTGLYYVNTSQQDELVSRRRAIVYGIIF